MDSPVDPFLVRVLTHPRWGRVLRQLKTARTYAKPVSFFRSDAADGSWTARDKILALVLEEYEAGLHSCGHHRDVAFSWDAQGWYSVGTVVCQSCAAIERHRESHPDPEPGTTAFAWLAATPSDHLLPWDGALTIDD